MATLIPALRQLLPEDPIYATVTLAASALFLTVALNVANQLLASKPNEPPMVFHWFPFIGSSVTYGMDPYKFFEVNRAKYGDVFTFVLAGRRVTVALGPPGSDLILNGKLSQVGAEEAYTNLTTPVFGSEVVYDCDNSLLMQQKKFMKFGLSTETFKKYVPIVVKETLDYVNNELFAESNIADKAAPVANTKPYDALTCSSQITICTAAATLQGQEVRSRLDKGFADIYHDLDGGFKPINFVFPNLPLPSYWKRDKAHVRMRHFYLDIIKERREKGDTGDKIDMLHFLTDTEYKDGTKVTDKQVAHMMIALLMAGQHTSAVTGSWLLLHLSEQPSLQEALFQEQLKAFGNADGTLRPLNYEELLTPLLKACLQETLRMHPPIHSILRYVRQDMPVPPTLTTRGHDYVIPAGHYVLASPGYSQMDAAFWEKPEQFDPFRWLTTKPEVEGTGETFDFGFGSISTGASSPYLPFGAGRHRCIGEQFANLQLCTILATIIREVKFNLVPERFPPQDYSTMLVAPQSPRDVQFQRRQYA